MKKILIAAIISSAIIVPAFSDEGKLKPIKIDEALEIALSGNRDLKISEKKLQETELIIKQAWSVLIPDIDIAASATRQGADSGIQSLSDGNYDVRFLQASLYVNPGVYQNGLNIALHERSYYKEETKRIRYSVTGDVIKNYFLVVRSSEMLKMRKDSLNHLKSNYDDVKNQFKNGNVPKFELLQAEVQYRAAEPAVIDAENLYRTSLDTFNTTLGQDDSIYTVDFDSALKMPDFKDTSNEEARLDSLTKIALKNRPEIIQLEIRKKQTEDTADISEATYLWPTFFATGNWGYTKNLVNSPSSTSANPATAGIVSNIAGDNSWQNTWQIRGGATYRISALLPFEKNHAKEKETRLKAEEFSVQIDQFRQAVKISVRKNYLSLRGSYMSLESKFKNIKTAEEGLRIAKESYRAGVIKNSDLLSAETALTTARASFIDGLYQYYSSLADLKKDLGTDNNEIIFSEEK